MPNSRMIYKTLKLLVKQDLIKNNNNNNYNILIFLKITKYQLNTRKAK